MQEEENLLRKGLVYVGVAALIIIVGALVWFGYFDKIEARIRKDNTKYIFLYFGRAIGGRGGIFCKPE